MRVMEFGCIALVVYVPAPLSAALVALRSSLPGEVHSPPHVTVLPPRPLFAPVDDVSPVLTTVIDENRPFRVVLDRVCTFSDTSVLYLSLGAGGEAVYELHEGLVAAHGTTFREEHAFRPHVTLAGPLPPDDLETAWAKAEAGWVAVREDRSFAVETVDCLWLPPGGAKHDWTRLWSRNLVQQEQIRRRA